VPWKSGLPRGVPDRAMQAATAAIMIRTGESGLSRIEGASAVVLAGGQSRRFGRSKAHALLGGTPLIGHVLEPLRRLFDDVTVVANEPAGYACFDVDVVADILQGAGALGGLLTGLVHSRYDHCFVVACDMPFLNPALIRRILGASRGRDVVVPVRERRPQPLHARYCRRCIPHIYRSIQKERFRIVDFYPDVVVEEVTEGAWRAVDPDATSFMNVNSPEDFERAAIWLAQRGTRSSGEILVEKEATPR